MTQDDSGFFEDAVEIDGEGGVEKVIEVVDSEIA